MNKVFEKKRLLTIIGILGFFFLVLLARGFYKVIHEDISVSTNIMPEYNELFTDESKSKLKLRVTAKSRIREASSAYTYDGKFYIYVYKVALANDLNLKKVISYHNEPGRWINYKDLSNSAAGGSSFHIYVDEDKSVLVNSVTLKCVGDSIQTLAQNDSLYCYSFRFNNFSIQYNNGPDDVLVRSAWRDMPGSIVFKKEKRYLYVISMIQDQQQKHMPPDLLYTIINK